MKDSRTMRNFKRNLRKTKKNKIIALIILAIGLVCAMLDGNATFLIIAMVFAIGLFFAKRNWIY